MVLRFGSQKRGGSGRMSTVLTDGGKSGDDGRETGIRRALSGQGHHVGAQLHHPGAEGETDEEVNLEPAAGGPLYASQAL